MVALCGAAILTSALVSCTAVPDEHEAAEPTSPPACAGLLGRDRAALVVRALGGEPLSDFSSDTRVDDAAEKVAAMAGRWRPGEVASAWEGSEPCGLQHPGSAARFNVFVHWGPLSFDLLRKKVPREQPYEPMGHGLYLRHSYDLGPVLWLAVPCKVKGAHPKQMEELPLGVRVRLERMNDAEGRLQTDVALHVARQMVRYIPCRNHPRIPDTVR